MFHTFLLLGINFLLPISYADNKQQKPTEQEPKKLITDEKSPKKLNPKPKINYVLPNDGSPDTNGHQGTRNGQINSIIELLLLVPSHFNKQSSRWERHTGITSSPQPLLYWYISKLDIKPYRFIEFKLIESGKPIITTQLFLLKKAGIQTLDLKNYEVKLKANKDYFWSISLVKSLDEPYSKLVDFASIKYVKVNDVLLRKLKKTTASTASIYAKSGIWYEAVLTILQHFESEAGDSSSKEELVALMKQVGLEKIVINY